MTIRKAALKSRLICKEFYSVKELARVISMKTNKELVVLFQGDISTSDSKYVKTLKGAGICAENISPIVFKFVNQEKLQDCLHNVNSYSGIIFTSTRAVNAVASIFTSKNLDIKNWTHKLNFSVGKATADLAHSVLNLETYGSESGNTENLCQFILEKCKLREKPFLFPCSNIRKDTIPVTLAEHGVQVEELICYETVPNSQFKEAWETLIMTEGLPEVLIFFSPSGVQNCCKIVLASYSDAEQLKFIALGPSTKKALSEAGIEDCKVAAKPDPESVLSIVKSVLDI